MVFSQGFFELLVFGALFMTGGGAVLLLVLLARDLKKGRTW
jgi:hypothetical protein